MPTDETPTEEAAAPQTPQKKRYEIWWDQAVAYTRRSPGVVAAVVALAIGFSGGFLLGKGADGFGPKEPAAGQSVSGPAWSLFGKPRAEGAARRGEPKPEGFAVWRTRLDTSRATPVACIEMSRPLDPSKSYGDYVLVAPDPGHAPAVTAKGSELCVAGMGFTDSRITLLKGLPGKGGDKLAANADVDFVFGDKPPYVGFAGEGVILPREDADGVGIETVNVSRLAIEVWRVPDRNLVRTRISAPDPTSEGMWASEWGDDSPNQEGRVVWKGEVAVQAVDGARVTTVFPLGAVLKEMKPGAYVIKAKDASGGRGMKIEGEGSYDSNPPAQANRWIVFTDMAMLAYDGSEALDVVVRSLKSAKVLPGVRVALVASNGEDLAEARADSSGRVRFARSLLKGEGAERAKMLMAYGEQGDLAVLDLDRSPVDLSKQGIGGRTEAITDGRTAKTAIDGYLYADRGIYRPGETVRLTAMIRDRDSRAVKDRKGAVVVLRPSGVEFRRYAFDKAPLGAVTAAIALPNSAPRGRWTAKLEIEGIEEATGELSFSVEDFAPQRLAVTVTGREEVPLGPGETRPVTVAARFLYGAIGAGLKTQGEMRMSADPDPFPGLKDYQWGDAQTPFESQYFDIGSTVTDGEGKATVNIDTSEVKDAVVPLRATVTASVFEPGGRPVREAVALKVRPRSLYYGVKVEQTDSDRGDPPVSLDVVAVNAAGQRIASTASYTLISENWDYDWFQQDGSWQWRRTSRDVVVQKGTLNIAPAKVARIARRLGWGDYRLVVEGADGARTVVRFASGWGAPAKDAEAPDFVRVSAGTKAYAQGDTVAVTIKAPYEGEAQIAVATDRVIDFQTARIGKNGATVRIPTSAAWGGGAYVMVTVIQPRDPVASPKPRRALGVVYVPLDPRGRKLTVEVGTPEKIGSRDMVEVPVAVRGLGLAQRAKVTVAAVDEGILRLTRFESPDPAKWYFGKRALTVNYRDDYGRLLDPNLGAPANVNFGADGIGGEGLTVTPIKTVALWSGVVETGLDGKARIRLPAADFNGELRIMAVAWTDEAVGSAYKAMTVREPVVADLNLPRFLAPGDKPVATLELHNVEGAAGGYTVETASSGGVLMTLKKVFQLALGQRIAEKIPFLAPTRTGIGKVGFKVSGPKFATAKDYPIQTRIGWSAVTRVSINLQQPGEAFTPSPSLLAGLAAGDVTMNVSYSPFRGFDPAPIAASLNRYPYGCTEQLVSAAYPLLYASEVAGDPKIGAGLGAAVGRLLDRQTLDGAFGLWRVGDGEADAWLGAYATDFLLEARKRGVAVPQASIDRALNAMRQISRPEGWTSTSYRIEYPSWWSRTPEESQKATVRLRSRASAYALYVMAKGGRGDLARLRWWHDVQMKSEASPLAKAHVAAGLAMMGDKARSRSAFRQAVRGLGYREEGDWYQSPLRDLAAVISLAYEAGEIETARGLQRRLENSVKDPDALNTQEQARLLQAAHFMLAAAGPMRIEATGASPLPGRWSVGKLADAKFVNRGKGALWRSVTVRGTTVEAPGPEASGVSVSKTLYTLGGALADPASLRQGDRVIVLLSGRSSQARTMALVVDDALPAGFEIETVLGPEDAQGGPFRFLGELSGADAQEARDDRFIAAMDLAGEHRFALAYVARAVTPGDFFLPGPEARDMYRPSVSARGAASRTVIASED